MKNKLKEKYNKEYHNNLFNWFISNHLDNERSIIDFDTCFTKRGNKNMIMCDIKLKEDKVKRNTLLQYSYLANLKTNDNHHIFCYIISCKLDKEDINKFSIVTAYEIKNFKEINYNKNISNMDFYKNVFLLTSLKQIKGFFNVETHIKYRNETNLNVI